MSLNINTNLFTNHNAFTTSHSDTYGGHGGAANATITATMTGTATPLGKVAIDVLESFGGPWIEHPELAVTNSAPTATASVPLYYGIRARVVRGDGDTSDALPSVSLNVTVTA